MQKVKVLDWIKNNTFTVIGIIIILSIVWYEQAVIQGTIKDKIDACNEYWVEEVERMCPVIAGNSYVLDVPYLNISWDKGNNS